MKTKKKKSSDLNDVSTSVTVNDATLELVQDMPLAMAVLAQDTNAVGHILETHLPAASANHNNNNLQVEDVTITKSVGEAFTGGRSTPVYHVQCCVVVVRSNEGIIRKRQRHFVIKLVLLPDEESSSDRAKVWMKRESYAVERRFYGSLASKLKSPGNTAVYMATHLTIPKLLYSDHREGHKPWPAACFLFNDLTHAGFPHHPDFLSYPQAKAALQWLATFHATFWKDLDAKQQVWSRGGFWTIKAKPGYDNDDDATIQTTTEGLAQQWMESVRWMEQKHPTTSSTDIRTVGKRLEAASESIEHVLTQQSCTIIHGDYKAANMFFSSGEDNVENDNNNDHELDQSHVAVLDFQFSGWGLGAEDVAYLLFPDARGDYFDVEEELLDGYYDALMEQLILQQKGGPSSLSRQQLQGQYELARLDLLRYWLGKGWVASTHGDAQLMTAVQSTLGSLDGGSVLTSQQDYHQAALRMVS